MAVTHTTYFFGSNNSGSQNGWNSFLAGLLAAYDWGTQSSIYNGPNDEWVGKIGKFYLNDTDYMIFEWYSYRYGDSYYRVRFVTSNKSTTLFTSEQWYSIYLTVGKTDKGVAFLFKAINSSAESNVMAYNFFVGNCTMNDQTARGVVFVADNGNVTVASHNGISTDVPFGTVIDPDRKAVLAPVVNTATGEVFTDICEMRYSPVQYNIMDVDGQGIYLCGKTVCLKDEEG